MRTKAMFVIMLIGMLLAACDMGSTAPTSTPITANPTDTTAAAAAVPTDTTAAAVPTDTSAVAAVVPTGTAAEANPTDTTSAAAANPSGTTTAGGQGSSGAVPGNQATTTVATPVSSPITLTMMLVDYNDATKTWLEQTIFPQFEQAHPGVMVSPVYETWSTIDADLQGYFAAGAGPDILNLGSEYAPIWGDKLANLDDYLGPAAWPDISAYLTSTLQTVTWNGHLTGMPWLTAPRAYMCRTDLEQPAQTWQDQIANVKAASKVSNNALQQAGLVTTGKMDDWQEFLELIQVEGGTLYKADGTPNFDSPEARAALQFMHDRYKAQYADETVADLSAAEGSRLADGTAACVWGNMTVAPPISDPIWDKIDISASPVDGANPNSKPVVQVFNDWLAVPAYSKNIELATQLLKVLGSTANLDTYNSQLGSFPPREDAWTGYVASSRALLKLAALMNSYGVAFADVRDAPKLNSILHKEIPAFLSDQEDLNTAINNIQTQYTQVEKDAGRIK